MKLELKCDAPGCGLQFNVDWPEDKNGLPFKQISFSETEIEPISNEGVVIYPTEWPAIQEIISLLLHHNIFLYERKTTHDCVKYGHGTFRGNRGEKVSTSCGIVILEKYK